MQFSSFLILSEWSARTALYPFVSGKLSRYISDKHIKSCLWTEIYVFKCVSFGKLYAVKLLRFQWQTERDLVLFQYPHDVGENKDI